MDSYPRYWINWLRGSILVFRAFISYLIVAIFLSFQLSMVYSMSFAVMGLIVRFVLFWSSRCCHPLAFGGLFNLFFYQNLSFKGLPIR